MRVPVGTPHCLLQPKWLKQPVYAAFRVENSQTNAHFAIPDVRKINSTTPREFLLLELTQAGRELLLERLLKRGRALDSGGPHSTFPFTFRFPFPFASVVLCVAYNRDFTYTR